MKLINERKIRENWPMLSKKSCILAQSLRLNYGVRLVNRLNLALELYEWILRLCCCLRYERSLPEVWSFVKVDVML